MKNVNPVLDAILERSSIRAFESRPIEEAKLELLRTAALAAPTAMNRRSQRFAFVTNKEVMARIDAAASAAFPQLKDRLAEHGVMYHPPLFVAVFAEKGRFSGADAGIAVENLVLAAQSLGLGSVILGMPAPAFEGEQGEKLMRELGVPEGFGFELAVSVGYPATEKKPHEFNPEQIVDID